MRRQGHTVPRNPKCCVRGRCDRRATRERRREAEKSKLAHRQSWPTHAVTHRDAEQLERVQESWLTFSEKAP